MHRGSGLRRGRGIIGVEHIIDDVNNTTRYQHVGDEDFGAVDEDVAVNNSDKEFGTEERGDAGAIFELGAVGYGAVDY